MMIPVNKVLPEGSQMVAIEIQETFITALKVSFFGGFVLALPVILFSNLALCSTRTS